MKRIPAEDVRRITVGRTGISCAVIPALTRVEAVELCKQQHWRFRVHGKNTFSGFSKGEIQDAMFFSNGYECRIFSR